jgi:hypothetical protein
MSTAHALFGRLGVIYDAPATTNPQAWFAEVARLIAGYSTAECDRAFDLIVKAHKGRAYPSVNEIVSACADARSILSVKRPLDGSAQDRARRYREQQARRLLTTTEIGHRALNEDWHQGLYEFVCEHGRQPHGQEQGRIIETTQLVNDIASGARVAPVATAALRALAQSIQARRAKLADHLRAQEAADEA